MLQDVFIEIKYLVLDQIIHFEYLYRALRRSSEANLWRLQAVVFLELVRRCKEASVPITQGSIVYSETSRDTKIALYKSYVGQVQLTADSWNRFQIVSHNPFKYDVRSMMTLKTETLYRRFVNAPREVRPATSTIKSAISAMSTTPWRMITTASSPLTPFTDDRAMTTSQSKRPAVSSAQMSHRVPSPTSPSAIAAFLSPDYSLDFVSGSLPNMGESSNRALSSAPMDDSQLKSPSLLLSQFRAQEQAKLQSQQLRDKAIRLGLGKHLEESEKAARASSEAATLFAVDRSNKANLNHSPSSPFSSSSPTAPSTAPSSFISPRIINSNTRNLSNSTSFTMPKV